MNTGSWAKQIDHFSADTWAERTKLYVDSARHLTDAQWESIFEGAHSLAPFISPLSTNLPVLPYKFLDDLGELYDNYDKAPVGIKGLEEEWGI